MAKPLRQPSSRARNIWFLCIWSASAIFCWRTIGQLVELSLNDDRYTYLVLIPILSSAIILWRRELFFREAQSGMRSGAAPLLLGFLVYWFSSSRWFRSSNLDIRLAVAVFGIAVIWISVFILCYGLLSFKAAIFPLLFLFLMVPLPTSLLERVITALQDGSATVTSILFRALNVPVIRHGLSFSLPGVDIEIAEQCSGIRSTLSLFITGILAAYLFLQSARQRIFLSLFTIPLAIFKNGVRIVTLSWLGVYVDPGFLHGKLHQYGGLPVSLLALGILAPVLFALRRSEGLLRHRRTAPLESATI